jgi:hypothetical protein
VIAIKGTGRRRSRANSDQAYVTALVDEVLGEQGLREHRFGWLRGDAGRTGRKAPLAVDAFYPHHGLVVEYHEPQHYRPVPIMDRRETISGPRSVQRRIYDERRREQVPAHGLRLVTIRADDLDANARGRLRRRDRDADREIVRRLLAATD